MDQKFFEDQFAALGFRFDKIEKRIEGIEKRIDGLEERIDGLEKRIDGLEKRMDKFEARMDSMEKNVNKIGIELEAIRNDVRLIPEGHVMLNQKFSRFESEYIHHAVEMRHDVLNLYKITYGDIERRVKELESAN